MNNLTSNPSAALEVAHHIVADRVQQAEARALVRSIRAQQCAADGIHQQRIGPTRPKAWVAPMVWMAARFAHPAH